MSPGVTTLPVASMRVAPFGTATLVPTAAMRPSRISTVAFSSFGPDTGYTVPPVMAIVWRVSTQPLLPPAHRGNGFRLVRRVGFALAHAAGVLVPLRQALPPKGVRPP